MIKREHACDKLAALALWRDALIASGVKEDRIVLINFDAPAAEQFKDHKVCISSSSYGLSETK